MSAVYERSGVGKSVADRLRRPQDAQPAGISLEWLGRVGGLGLTIRSEACTDNGGALGLLDVAPNRRLRTGGLLFLEDGARRTRKDCISFSLEATIGAMLQGFPTRTSDRRQPCRAGANIAYSVRDLYVAGARKFVLINSPK